MKRARRGLFAIAMLGITTFYSVAPGMSASDVSALQGAWLQQSMSCDQVFVSTKRGMAFRKPVDMFAPAFIVSGSRITTPGATCRIQSVSLKGDRKVLSLSCATSIAVDTAKAVLSVAQDGSLYRYTSEDDKDGSKYDRCRPKMQASLPRPDQGPKLTLCHVRSASQLRTAVIAVSFLSLPLEGQNP
jgi:hypothetical protein